MQGLESDDTCPLWTLKTKFIPFSILHPTLISSSSWTTTSLDCLPLDSDHLPFVNCQFVDSAGVLRGSLLLVGASVSSSTWNCWGTMEVYGEWRERDILSEVFLLSINQDIHQLGGEYTQVSRSNAELRSTLSYICFSKILSRRAIRWYSASWIMANKK